jgi:hypothetical protein
MSKLDDKYKVLLINDGINEKFKKLEKYNRNNLKT